MGERDHQRIAAFSCQSLGHHCWKDAGRVCHESRLRNCCACCAHLHHRRTSCPLERSHRLHASVPCHLHCLGSVFRNNHEAASAPPRACLRNVHTALFLERCLWAAFLLHSGNTFYRQGFSHLLRYRLTTACFQRLSPKHKWSD